MDKYIIDKHCEERVTCSVILATTKEELDQVYRLRYQVYVQEKNYFDGTLLSKTEIKDEFDEMPNTLNLLLLYNGIAVGTIRITGARTVEEKLPSDCLFDFTDVKIKHKNQLPISIGMLAVLKNYQSRKNFFTIMLALGKIILKLKHEYCIFTLNHECIRLISRLIGAKAIAEKIWSEQVSEYVIPMLVYKNQIINCYRKNTNY